MGVPGCTYDANSTVVGCWPRTYVIGAQKGATSSIFEAFASVNAICGAKCHHLSTPSGRKWASHIEADVHHPEVKEAHYWDYPEEKEIYDAAQLPDADDYRSCYISEEALASGNNIFMDATPSYLIDHEAPHRMALAMAKPSPTFVQTIKLLAILREPVSRDLAEYNMFLRWPSLARPGSFCPTETTKPDPFPAYADVIDCRVNHWHAHCGAESGVGGGPSEAAYAQCDKRKGNVENQLTRGMYSAQVKRWAKVFDRRQIMVLQMEQMVDAQPETLKAIWRFLALGRDESRVPTALPAVNEDTFPGRVLEEQVPCAAHSRLLKALAPWNVQLFKMLDDDRAAGRAPPEEPDFEPWGDGPCLDDGSAPENENHLRKRILPSPKALLA